MSIQSMTGHGRGEAAIKGAKVIVELGAVNHKQFDLRIDLPPGFALLEMEMRKMIHDCLARGSVHCRVHFYPPGGAFGQRAVIDEKLLAQCMHLSRITAARHGIRNDLAWSSFFSVPGVIKVVSAEGNPAVFKRPAMRALTTALNILRKMRAAEGHALCGEIRRRLTLLEQMQTRISRRYPEARRRHRDKLCALLRESGKCLPIDKKLLKEAVMAAERGDIAEELERSQSHISQFRRLLDAKEPVGRTMDFLVQEMMREINTIGAKANDCLIANLVVRYKSELENIREQVQNIE